MSESPFKISVPDANLDRLQQKLKLTTLPDELEGAGWDYGVPLADVKRLVARWSDGYDWRHHEALLNAELPQFTRAISVEGHGTLAIHYVHQRSEAAGAIPLLFVHGWPGSFLEARKIVPLLSEKSADHPSFHVVVLGLPGYGFSEGPSTKGFDMAQYAEARSSDFIFNDTIINDGLAGLIRASISVTQGGDWGFPITRTIALIYGEKHSKAWHTNLVLGAPPADQPNAEITPKEQAALARTEWFRSRGSGYLSEQSTQPQTLGYSLADSPVGLLAWIYEKLVLWTDKYSWDDDEGILKLDRSTFSYYRLLAVLTWVSIFWFSRAGPAASVRIYFEAGNRDIWKAMAVGPEVKPTIPLGLSHFPNDVMVFPKRRTRERGAFAAYEKPNELVGDLRKMFGKDGPAFGAVPGQLGYS
ncbi:Alpha/Beta hydrolase protein [Mycena rosella]|uniref:Alpha/Beta hydrolase protein n=1 Tax=Mycena rosella TaxID=1033263 RepID=A0AAD7D6D7_MYCRO|nr:Alpha/Beta hydrolase protein [Mycena rosella]